MTTGLSEDYSLVFHTFICMQLKFTSLYKKKNLQECDFDHISDRLSLAGVTELGRNSPLYFYVIFHLPPPLGLFPLPLSLDPLMSSTQGHTDMKATSFYVDLSGVNMIQTLRALNEQYNCVDWNPTLHLHYIKGDLSTRSTYISMYNWSGLYVKWKSIKALIFPENLQNIPEIYCNAENFHINVQFPLQMFLRRSFVLERF